MTSIIDENMEGIGGGEKTVVKNPKFGANDIFNNFSQKITSSVPCQLKELKILKK